MMSNSMFSGVIKRVNLVIFLVIDFFAIIFSLFVAFLLRFDFVFPTEYAGVILYWIVPILLIKLSSFYVFNLYKGMFRFTSIWDLSNIVKANVISSSIIIIFFGFIHGYNGFPRSVFLLDLLVSTAVISLSRIAVRLYYSNDFFYSDHISSEYQSNFQKKRIILIGAGRAGEKIAREILSTPAIGFEVVGFVDDNARKHGATLHGVKVMGSVEDLLRIKIPYDELLITAPSAVGDNMRHIVDICKATGKRYKTIPDLSEIINDDVSIKMVRDVSYIDLLKRDEVILDTPMIKNFIRGKRVLVTGAGGSIGSELVRQCTQFDPAMLILLDNSEFNLFSIQQELFDQQTETFIRYTLASVRDKKALSKVFNDYKPHVILHAAAYKHVPLQEDHPWEAINTNVIGTANLIELSLENDLEKFVLVSTDKAVHPVNVMGATKRLAEIMVQAANREKKTSFIAVRFGNVLGSSGSVIPIFERQIKAGGPVKITHPQMIRYFMSIPEAAQLILQASAIRGGRGKIFVLDMGKPVNIKDMAYDLIRLSGFEPEIDIPVVYTGVRPGEKLYEELMFDGEIFSKTDHHKIMTLKNNINYELSWKELLGSVHMLGNLSENFDHNLIKEKLIHMIPEYKPKDTTSTLIRNSDKTESTKYTA